MINYKQLYYFWCVAKYGGVTRAAEQIHLTPQTISGQVSQLEAYLGTDLFIRKGKRLELTTYGKLAYSHSDEIFQIGRELESLVKSRQDHQDTVLKIGVSAVVPKSIAFRLLEPVQHLQEDFKLVCHEDKLNNLFAELALHKIDVIIADKPMPANVEVKAYSHLLGESKLSFFGVPKLVKKLKKNFPESLNGAPILVPNKDSSIRMKLEAWLTEKGISPRIKGVYDDTALMKVFAKSGLGIFPAPDVVADEAFKQHGVIKLGTVDEISLKYYAISVERRLKHPAVIAISEGAHESLFV